MMKQWVCAVLVVMFGITLGVPTKASAGEVDILIQKLVEKNVLTPMEAQIILDETKAAVGKELAEGTSYAAPEWSQKITLKGDFRTRYQYEQVENKSASSSNIDRNRMRTRFRLGMDAKVNDKVKVGAGLASGPSDGRSTNQTLENGFMTPDIRLDYAYGAYAPFTGVELIGGKFKNNLWMTSDIMWDSDLNPEGAGLNLKYPMTDKLDLFWNSGFYILDERKTDNTDPHMWAFQPGFSYDLLPNKINFKNAFSYYKMMHVKGAAWSTSSSYSVDVMKDGLQEGDWNSDTNTLEGSNLKYDYSVLSYSAELGFKNPLGENGIIKYFAPFGDLVYNPNPDHKNSAYVIGAKIGDQKVDGFGTWQAKYMVRRLDKDAWLDLFPDSDFLGGKTNVNGHEITLDLGLMKNWSLGLDYYRSFNRATKDNVQDLVQIDLNYKF